MQALRFHLSTAILLLIVSSIILGLNIKPQYLFDDVYACGWPFVAYYSHSLEGLSTNIGKGKVTEAGLILGAALADLSVAIGIIVCVAFMKVRFLRLFQW
jgi:hypothetical protein